MGLSFGPMLTNCFSANQKAVFIGNKMKLNLVCCLLSNNQNSNTHSCSCQYLSRSTVWLLSYRQTFFVTIPIGPRVDFTLAQHLKEAKNYTPASERGVGGHGFCAEVVYFVVSCIFIIALCCFCFVFVCFVFAVHKFNCRTFKMAVVKMSFAFTVVIPVLAQI